MKYIGVYYYSNHLSVFSSDILKYDMHLLCAICKLLFNVFRFPKNFEFPANRPLKEIIDCVVRW